MLTDGPSCREVDEDRLLLSRGSDAEEVALHGVGPGVTLGVGHPEEQTSGLTTGEADLLRSLDGHLGGGIV